MKKITKKKIIIAAVISVLVCLFVIGEDRIRYFYFEVLIPHWYEMMGKNDYEYIVLVRHTSQQLTINNGKKEKVMKPIEHLDGMDNCRWEYNEEGKWSYYSIMVMEGDELSVTGDEVFAVDCNSSFPINYTCCKRMQVGFDETRDFHFSVEKERIRFWSEDNLGSRMDTLIYPGSERKEWIYINHDFGQEIYALEIRRREDGIPMTYVDLDGDGYCECDCEKYRTKKK